LIFYVFHSPETSDDRLTSENEFGKDMEVKSRGIISNNIQYFRFKD